MEKITYYCDVCHKEMQRTSPPYETLVKRISTQYPDPNGRYLEIAVVVRAWSGQMDICRTVQKGCLRQTLEGWWSNGAKHMESSKLNVLV